MVIIGILYGNYSLYGKLMIVRTLKKLQHIMIPKNVHKIMAIDECLCTVYASDILFILQIKLHYHVEFFNYIVEFITRPIYTYFFLLMIIDDIT